jgi:hypothetical protein
MIKIRKTFALRVLAYIEQHPGCSSIEVAIAFKAEPSRVYGYQRPTSTAIAELRRREFLSDVAKCCKHCGSALTRNTQNVPLYVTPAGSATLAMLRDAA